MRLYIITAPYMDMTAMHLEHDYSGTDPGDAGYEYDRECDNTRSLILIMVFIFYMGCLVVWCGITFN
jgi:hypothetical protein